MQLEVINILILHSEEYSVLKAGHLPMNFTLYYCLLQVSCQLPGRTVSDTAVSHMPQLFSKQEVKLKMRDSWVCPVKWRELCKLPLQITNASEWMARKGQQSWLSRCTESLLPEKGFGPCYLIPVQLCYRHVYGEMNFGEATHLIWLASVRFWVEMKAFTLQKWGSFALSLYITSAFHTERALGSGLSWRKAKLWIMIYQ